VWLPALAGALVLFVAAFRQFFDPSRCIATFPDATYMVVPLFHHASRCFAAGEYPYWIEMVMGGLPLYDSPMFSVEYPLYLLRLPLFTDPVRAMWAVHAVSVLHLGILAATSYVMMRCLRLAWLPAAFGAAVLTTCPNSFDYAEWVNMSAPYSWFPLVVAGMVLALDPSRGMAGVLIGGTALGLLCLAMPAQALIHACFVGAVLFAFAAQRRRRAGDRAAIRGMVRRFAALGALGLLLGSPALIPATLAMKGTIRFNGEFPAIIGGDSVPLAHSLHGQLTPAELAGTLLPVQVTKLNGHSFIGLGAGLFACLGLTQIGRHRQAAAMAFLAAYGLLSATGTHLGFAYLNHVLPLMNKFRQPPRHLFLFVLAASALAAIGLQRVLAAPRLRERRILTFTLVFAVLAALSLCAPLPWLDPRAAAVIAGGALLGAGLVVVGRHRRARLAAVAGAVTIVAANFAYPTRVPTLEDGDTFGAANMAMHGVLKEVAALPQASAYRVLFLAGDDTQFLSMDGIYYGIRTVQAYMNPLPYRQFDEVFQRFNLRHYYPMLGARYVLCDRCDERMLADYRPLRSLGKFTLLTTEAAQPLYAVRGRVSGTYRDAEAFYALVDGGADVQTGLLVADTVDGRRVTGWLPDGAVPSASVQEVSRTVNRMRVRVTSDRPAVLVVNQYRRSPWEAKVNGAPVPTHEVNLNQIGVLVGAGTSEVELEYRPTLYRILLGVERATSALLLLGAFLWTARQARRKRGAAA